MIRYLLTLFLVLFLCSCSEPPAARGAKVEHSLVESVITGVNSGTVRSEKIADLAFGTVGRVKALNVDLGDKVEEGEILAELENEDLLSQLRNAQQESERRRKLNSEKMVSLSELEGTIRQVDVARGAYEKSLIRAPFSGIITELNLEVGQLSQITAVMPKPLMKIIDLEKRYVRAEMDEVDLGKLKLGQPARVKILAVRSEPFAATVRRVIPYVSTIKEQDRTSEIELTVESEGILLPVGASADVEVVIERKESVLSVPSRALLGRGTERYVFVEKDGRAERRDVKIGLFNYDRAEIIAGLSEGEVVILPNETLELSDGTKVSVTVN